MMEITVSDFGHRSTRLMLAGDLDICGAEKLDLPLAALAGSGGTLVVDMTRLDSIASIGIRHLVLAARTLARGRGQLLVLGPNPFVTRALIMAGVIGLLPILQSEDEAWAAVNSGVAAPAASPRSRACSSGP